MRIKGTCELKKEIYSWERKAKTPQQQILESDRKGRWARRGNHVHKGHLVKNTARRRSPSGLTLATYGHREAHTAG